MNWHKWLIGVCLFLAVCDLRCFGSEICAVEQEKGHRRRTTPGDAFSYRSVPVPVKVRCDAEAVAVKSPEPSAEDIRLITSVREKQKAKMEPWRTSPETTSPQPEKPGKDAPALPKGRTSETMVAECEQCEIQIKANGDGVFLRCRKCHPTSVERMRFPNPNPNKVLQVP